MNSTIVTFRVTMNTNKGLINFIMSFNPYIVSLW